jgi:DNA mismatch endonuclease (patch repair protein)
MTDIFSPAQRSILMSKVKGRDNEATEKRLVRIFKEFGIHGWRRNARIFGRPDFVFPTARLAVFVDGCFWHGCPVHGSIPASNTEFWENKINRNKERDKIVGKELRRSSWRILRVWQHELCEPKRVASRVKRLLARKSV